MKKALPHLLLQFVLLAAVAIVSGYRLPSFEDADWDTVLFLTPSGIVSNHLRWSILREFYSDASAGQIALSPLQGALLAALIAALLANLIVMALRLRRTP